MFMKRAITALVALAGFLGALFLLPHEAWALLLVAVLGLAASEWATLSTYGSFGRIAYVALLIVSAALLYFVPLVDVYIFALSCAFWFLVAPLWLRGHWKIRNAFVLGAAGWVALVPMWLALVRLQAAPATMLMILGVVWVADTAAYLAGKGFGRHKLAPVISPGKTWEGGIGAALAVAIYYAVLVALVSPEHRHFSTGLGLVLFLLVFVLSVEGDLFESWLKRQAGVKDSGQLLPGHGGVLDRIDGLTATMPLAALAFQLR